MSELQWKKKRGMPSLAGSAPRQTQQQPSSLLRLQDDAGNRAVSELLGSLSGVPQPTVMRTPLGVTATVYFAHNSAFLDAENFRVVEELAQELGFLFEPVVAVDGHASSEGKEEYNLALSERRRQNIVTLLTARLKAKPNVAGEALGEMQPAVPEDAKSAQVLEQQRAHNRRVEITILRNPRTPAEPKEPQIDLRKWRPQIEPPRPPSPFDLELPPAIERPKFSIGGEFDKKFNQVADDVLDELGIKKPWMRSLLKKGARAAIDKGADTLLDKAMDEAGLQGQTREALKNGLKAGLKLEF